MPIYLFEKSNACVQLKNPSQIMTGLLTNKMPLMKIKGIMLSNLRSIYAQVHNMQC